MRIFIIVSALSLFLLVGCSKSGAPSCNDGTVKKLVFDISLEEQKDKLFRDELLEAAKRIPPNSPQSKSDMCDKMIFGVFMGTTKYDDAWNKIKKDDPCYETIRGAISVVDQKIAKVEMNLVNIRIIEKLDDIKKCSCEGDLSFFSDGRASHIMYAAQYTEDGKVYVKILDPYSLLPLLQ
jgi:hypothetical protein